MQTFLIFLLLAGIAVANAYYLFNQRRRYDFRTRKVEALLKAGIGMC